MDPISDMFIRIKNAQKAGHPSVQVSYSKFKHEIAKALERGSKIGVVEKKGKRIGKLIEIKLLYNEKKPSISEVKLISKPSRRIYVSYKDIRPASYGGVSIISTSRGVMSGKEAKKVKLGGELIAEVW